jgi:hypothetical protein
MSLFTVIKPLRPQSKHTGIAKLQLLIARDEYLRSSLTTLSANFTFHEELIYRTRPSSSNPLTVNWLAIGGHRFLVIHFNRQPQPGFLIVKLSHS